MTTAYAAPSVQHFASMADVERTASAWGGIVRLERLGAQYFTRITVQHADGWEDVTAVID
jgi:hypothetical protein